MAVSGGTGVVGRALVRHLLGEGHTVRALVRNAVSGASLEELGVETVRGDLLDAESLSRLSSGCEVFFNVAGVNELCAKDPEMMERVNVDGVRNVLAACERSGVRRVVHTSSAVTLGEVRGSVGTEDTAHRGWFISEYERTKSLGERVLFAESGDTEVVSVNPSSVQGPGRATGTGKIILDVVNGDLSVLVDTTVSLVDIDDCSRGHLLAATAGRPGRRYVLSGSTLSVRSALAVAEGALGQHLRPRFLPGWMASLAVGVAEPIARMVGTELPFCREMIRVLRFGHSYDGTMATRELGLEYSPIENTIERTLRWFESEGLLGRASRDVRSGDIEE